VETLNALCWSSHDGCVLEDNIEVKQKQYILGYMPTADSFWFTVTDGMPTEGSTHLLEKPTILIIAVGEVKSIPVDDL
jgi:hypothetical protein